MNPSIKKPKEPVSETPPLGRVCKSRHTDQSICNHCSRLPASIDTSPQDRPYKIKEEHHIYFQEERQTKSKAQEENKNPYIPYKLTRPLPPLPFDQELPRTPRFKGENKENTTFHRSLSNQEFGFEYDVHGATSEVKKARRASDKFFEESRVDISLTSLPVSESSLDSLANAEILTATSITIKKIPGADIKVPRVIRAKEEKREDPKQRMPSRREERIEFGYMLNIPREPEYRSLRSRQDEKLERYRYLQKYTQQHGQVYGRGYNQIGTFHQRSALQLPPPSPKKKEKENEDQKKTIKAIGPFKQARGSFGRQKKKARFPLESDTEDEVASDMNHMPIAGASSRDVRNSDRIAEVGDAAAENVVMKRGEPVERITRPEHTLSPIKPRGQRHPYSPPKLQPAQNKSPERTRPVVHYYHRGASGYTSEGNRSPTFGGGSSRGARRSSAPPPRRSSYGERLAVPNRPQHDLRRARYSHGSPLRPAASTGTLHPTFSTLPTSPPNLKEETGETVEKKKTSKIRDFFKKF
ncbi:hypothetical protein TWF694_009844 [Orbilia ellipsospora]|uniref:Uncharacterized protein n=1 Tax=Orbilia ellipsospora TaxID=2528407 RepID=A0AAV9XCJ7_9PEZI